MTKLQLVTLDDLVDGVSDFSEGVLGLRAPFFLLLAQFFENVQSLDGLVCEYFLFERVVLHH